MGEHPMYPPVKPARINEADHAVESFKKIREAALAIPADKVGRVTADIPVAASIALGALYNLEQLRPEFEEQLKDGGAAARAVGELKDCALGALYAHVQSAATLSANELGALLEEAKPLRQNLLGCAESLAGFGIFPESTVAAIREGLGNVDVAKDLIALSALFNSNWERVVNKVPFDQALALQASVLGTRLLRALGAQEVGEARLETGEDWMSLRTRAFRLLVNTYEVVRRAAAYVRWYEGDASAFTPSLHARSVPRRGGSNDSIDIESPIDSLLEQPAPTSEQAELGGVSPGPAVIEPGLRGASPFAQ